MKSLGIIKVIAAIPEALSKDVLLNVVLTPFKISQPKDCLIIVIIELYCLHHCEKCMLFLW